MRASDIFGGRQRGRECVRVQACRLVAWPDALELDVARHTLGSRELATGMEAAAARQPERVRERARDRDRFAVGAVHVQCRREQPARVGVPRAARRQRGPGLDEAAGCT